jgi:transposase
VDLRACRAKYRALAPTLTERSRRVWAATEARALGRGGMALVARATGISTSTIGRGLSELRSRARLPAGRVRRPGGGRKRTIDKDPTLLRDLEGLVEPTTSGAPDSPLRWTAKSTRTLAQTLQSMGHRVSHQLVRELLSAAGYSLQANRKTREGPPHLTETLSSATSPRRFVSSRPRASR